MGGQAGGSAQYINALGCWLQRRINRLRIGADRLRVKALLRGGFGFLAKAEQRQHVGCLTQRLGAVGAQQLVRALAQGAVYTARHSQHRPPQPLGMADSVGRAAADARLGDAERFGLRRNKPVAG